MVLWRLARTFAGETVPKETDPVKARWWCEEMGLILVEKDEEEPDTTDADVDKLTKRRDRKEITATQYQRLVDARRGQGRYRQDMIELWEGQCAVTGIYTLRMLVASHAKPGADPTSTDEEKLDPNNGLLLAGTLDKAFDGYLMSVHPESGKLLFSDAIDETERARLVGGLTHLRKTPTAAQAVYLKAHYKRFLAKLAERSSKLRQVA